MTKIYKCKCHGADYHVCPHCACQYCEKYWPTCPRCAEIQLASTYKAIDRRISEGVK